MTKSAPLRGPKARNITVDTLVIGSGTGMAAALAARELGLSVLVVEKTAYVGGSTARSGGAFWIPANRVLKRSGSDDTLEEAGKYLEAAVGDAAPKARYHAFLKQGPAAVEMLERTTSLKFFWAREYADYHSELPGGSSLGRACESKPFDLSVLGKERLRLRPPAVEAPLPMPITGADYRWINLMARLPMKVIPLMLRRLLKGIGGRLLGKRYVATGQALAAGMFAGLIKADVPVWTRARVVELLAHDECVVGAVVEQDGEIVRVQVRKGVVLAAGGFDHNMTMRHQYQSASLKANLSLGAEGNTGDAIDLAQSLGADRRFMNEAWWFPAIAPVKGGSPLVLLAERASPGSFIVDSNGSRFVNEAKDYMSFGQSVLARENEGNPVGDMWLIFDQGFRNSYVLGGTVFPRAAIPKSWFDERIAFVAETPSELARAVGLPEAAFQATLDRFNAQAARGRDTDYHRGDSAYDRYYGDPTVQPNPNLRALGQRLYAVKVVLSDLGTCGGLAADEYARVLRTDATPINGLYAIGNNAGNAFGHVYPGAGATIGQGVTFGYIAAQHMASTAQHFDIPKAPLSHASAEVRR
ncbi:3-ketosteroid-delta-1-dehydrogenase [Rhizobium tropici]|uniref:3-ketosteroid-delta-1-dehydrogenase n=1 Tax=Rhizobium tropici TaxID=398 RepID=A0A5B0VR79_RHITR|nr:3-ketosteroid-delta-1-dehydrogenase [Rhizobium tropici]KAA1176974.1 3-ketosteroid-delta-1-dehydrogenase [Rhizobium tropici]